ncbi:MAG TPA: alpha/beta hydrolase [Chthoniobacteraceae bacterium]|nr:alpha/beta hydrolase [Chthoniobacteraceae bacterium]
MSHYPLEISPDVELLRDVPYGAVAGRKLLLDLALPKKRDPGAPLPSFVYMHGGAWESGSKADGVPAVCYYAAHGFAAASIDYRLSGEAQFPAALEDCKCAVRFLRAHAGEYGIDPRRIGAMGASSGGHLAAMVGLTPAGKFEGDGGWGGFSSAVCAVCDLFGVHDFLRMPAKPGQRESSAAVRFLGGTPERYIEASPLNHVHTAAPPFLFIHGDSDPVVPLQQSELMHKALKKAGARSALHVVKGAAHGSRNVITPEVREVILGFLRENIACASS